MNKNVNSTIMSQIHNLRKQEINTLIPMTS